MHSLVETTHPLFGIIFVHLRKILKSNKMAKVAGITIEKSYRGIPRYVRIDLKKHADIIPFLQEKGVISEPDELYNKKFVSKIRKSESEESVSIDLEKYGIKI
ncbi:MAG: hypothetical protein QM751_00905 [Paludibacteraceae bacterium]